MIVLNGNKNNYMLFTTCKQYLWFANYLFLTGHLFKLIDILKPSFVFNVHKIYETSNSGKNTLNILIRYIRFPGTEIGISRDRGSNFQILRRRFRVPG